MAERTWKSIHLERHKWSSVLVRFLSEGVDNAGTIGNGLSLGVQHPPEGICAAGLASKNFQVASAYDSSADPPGATRNSRISAGCTCHERWRRAANPPRQVQKTFQAKDTTRIPYPFPGRDLVLYRYKPRAYVTLGVLVQNSFSSLGAAITNNNISS